MAILVALVFALAAVSSTIAAKPPIAAFVPTCSKSQSNLNECVKQSAQLLIPHLTKGIREYNMPSIDPLQIPFLSLSQSDKPVGLKLNISDTTHYGVSQIEVTAAKINLEKNRWEFKLHFPVYTIMGVCDLGGRILLLPITGHGPCNLTSSEMDGVIVIDTKLTKGKQGKEYYKFNKFSTSFTFHKGAFKLEGLFGGNKELGATMNRFLNENAVDVFNEMKKTIQDVFSEVYGGLLSRMFAAVPADEVFKP